MTIRPIRLAAGWSLALVAALLLNLVLTRTTTAPEGAVLSAQQPHATAQPSAPSKAPARVTGDPIDRLPRVVALPPGADTGSGTARPQELIPLRARQAAGAAGGHPSGPRGLRPGCPGDRRLGARHQLGWTGASGWARDGLTRLDGSSPFAIASITKTFTAALTLQLVDEGRLG